MVFDYSFWKFIVRPESLASQLPEAEMRKFKSRMFFVFFLAVVLFTVRSFWGYGTESFTSLLVTDGEQFFALARLLDLIAAGVWGIIYVAFHLFAVAFLFAAFTEVPARHFVPLQLLVVGLFLMEKALVFGLSAMQGAWAPVSFLSLGPIAMTYIDNDFLVYFFNQLTVTVVLVISIQYRFLKTMDPEQSKGKLLGALIGLHIAAALIVAGIQIVPFNELFDTIVGGGK
ncbi:hypothetical protein GOP80_01640 [Planococcaceae bacterium Storch 2/2-2]|nr:hypothetical protein [Planococcaceae bacterium Storch 2/2-2]